MGAKDIDITRDLENDVLYVMRKDAYRSNTINVSMSADILVRVDRSTKEVVGVTIEDFGAVLPQLAGRTDYELSEKFDSILRFLEAPNLVSS